MTRCRKTMKSTPRPRVAAPTSILPFVHLPRKTSRTLTERPQWNQVLADDPQQTTANGFEPGDLSC